MSHRYKAHKSDPNQNKPWLVCSLCGAAVQLVCLNDKNRTFYFRHNPEEEDRGCPVNTKGKYSADQINAMKYNGAKESLAHQRLKDLLRQSILCDPSFESQPKIEEVWRGMDRKTWRKPDVQAIWRDIRFAFEIQLSTTFLSVIVDRRDFYKNNTENGCLLWIFQSFIPGRTRRAEEDIFYNNNSNVFVVNQHTFEKSKEKSRLSFECWFPIPQLQNGSIFDYWEQKIVFIDELTFEQKAQRIFFYDYEKERRKVERKLAQDKVEHEQNLKNKEKAKIRDLFVNFWKTHGGSSSQQGRDEWDSLRSVFKEYQVSIPEFYDVKPFSGVVSIMLSAKYGYPVGYASNTLIQVTNTAFEYYKNYLYLFGKALQAYGRYDLLDIQDTKGTWQKRREMIRKAMRENNEASKNGREIPFPEYKRDSQFDELILFLLPELEKTLSVPA